MCTASHTHVLLRAYSIRPRRNVVESAAASKGLLLIKAVVEVGRVVVIVDVDVVVFVTVVVDLVSGCCRPDCCFSLSLSLSFCRYRNGSIPKRRRGVRRGYHLG